MPAIAHRLADTADHKAMEEFILTHGPNDWNYLTPANLANEFAALESGRAVAVLALVDGVLAGYAVLNPGCGRFTEDAPAGTPPDAIAYIGNVVADQAMAGQGIGTGLLKIALDEARARGQRVVFIERHEENPGSAGMMRKTGFEIVRVYDDPARRWSGSRRSALCRYLLD